MSSAVRKTRPAKQKRGRSISIAFKLTAGFAVLVVLLLVGSGWSYYSLNQVMSQYEEILAHNVPVALAAKDLYGEMQVQSQQIMGYATTREQKAVQAIKESQKRSGSAVAKLAEAAQRDPKVSGFVASIEEKRKIFNNMVNSSIQNGEEMDSYQLVLAAESTRNMGNAVGQLVGQLVTYLEDQARTAQTRAATAAEQAAYVLTLLGAVSTILGVAVSIFAYRTIAKPLRNVAEQLRQIAEGSGDLTRELKVNSADEIGMLGESFNKLVSGLSEMVRKVIVSSQEIHQRCQSMMEMVSSVTAASSHVSSAMDLVAAGSQRQTNSSQNAANNLEELNQAIEQIASSAQHQAIQVQETTDTVRQMVTNMESVASTAAQMSATSDQAARRAEEGAQILDTTLAGMQRIHERVSEAATRVQELGTYGGRIGEMLTVITEIAEQTNLLALNAAIEAARAGEQGRGFAVVAEEVRRLAERSSASVKEIRPLVESISKGTRAAVASMNESTEDVRQSVDLSNQAGEALGQILQAVKETTQGIQYIHRAVEEMVTSGRAVSGAVQEIAAVTEENSAASEEMAAGAEQVSQSVHDLASISESNSKAVEEVAASLGEVSGSVTTIQRSLTELTEIAGLLRGLVAQFKV
ncbi:MAG: methyl-accepting chemotaxis protein [Bacillota bacterium]